ncbi:MAG: hypothetical protein E7480_04530 [Ruminococcaceae bacterium]|nr:hypothetical protein [Oscillospiraceae bacterium]
MRIKKVLASDIAALDSNVYTGGGTDDTAALQAALDEAAICGGVHLIMDGAALISGLRVHSNTTIECLSRDCGFYQMNNSNQAIITNYDWDLYENKTKNVVLQGGTYNQNCLNQVHDTTAEETPYPDEAKKVLLSGNRHWVFGLEFYGIEYLTVRDITLRDFRTFSTAIGGFRNVTIENVWLNLPNRMHGQNQDGFHFWGPGQFLTVKNTGGHVGDDFMNLGPDEMDCRSSITDVLIDGVYLEDADQSIRMLSRNTGTLDRVTVRNVSGTYRSFGFYINNWFPGNTYGDFKNIFIENIDLRQTKPNYDYRAPILFGIGGNIESLIMKNIRHHQPTDNRTLFEIGRPFYDLNFNFPADNLPRMENIVIDGLTIMEETDAATDAEYIQVYLPVERLALKDVTVIRKNIQQPDGHLLAVKEQGAIDRLDLQDISANGFKTLVDGKENIKNTDEFHVRNFK